MNLYLISQTDNVDYDTYDSAVVAAETENDARWTYPSGDKEDFEFGSHWSYSDWTTPECVHVQLIGKALPGTEAGVICASFNAG